jgi:hypothetical protein
MKPIQIRVEQLDWVSGEGAVIFVSYKTFSCTVKLLYFIFRSLIIFVLYKTFSCTVKLPYFIFRNLKHWVPVHIKSSSRFVILDYDLQGKFSCDNPCGLTFFAQLTSTFFVMAKVDIIKYQLLIRITLNLIYCNSNCATEMNYLNMDSSVLLVLVTRD